MVGGRGWKGLAWHRATRWWWWRMWCPPAPPSSGRSSGSGKLGVDVVAATALLDRSPAVADRFAAAGIEWRPLLRWADLGIEPL